MEPGMAEEIALIPERVAAGKKYLAETYPDFKPNKARLRMESCSLCMLGQAMRHRNQKESSDTYASFWSERKHLGLDDATAISLGFQHNFKSGWSSAAPYYDALTAEWLRQLPD